MVLGGTKRRPLQKAALHRRGQRLFVEAGYGGGFVGVDVEDGEELGDLEEVVNFLGQVEELELAATVANGSKSADQFADAGTIDVVDVAKIENDFDAAGVENVANGLAQQGATFAQGDTPAEVHQGDRTGLPRR